MVLRGFSQHRGSRAQSGLRRGSERQVALYTSIFLMHIISTMHKYILYCDSLLLTDDYVTYFYWPFFLKTVIKTGNMHEVSGF
jgi:hypothetical protein